jgi:drug/metabolite transporter (DMT)-like permease
LPSALASAGIIIGAMSVILLSFNPRFEGRRALGLAMAAVSGLLYGTMFIVIDMFDPLAGYWPVVLQRMVAMCCFVVPALVVGRPAMPPRGLRWQAVLGGLIGGVGLLSFAYGVREGDLAPVAVAATQYAAVTVFLAFCFRGERLRWWQTIGLFGSSAAVALVIAG